MKKISCVMCRKPLNNGIMIKGIRICKSCEEKMIKEDTITDFYSYYVNCIKKYIIYQMIKGEDTKCQNYHL
ncbi:hypothetical protein K144316041_00460 [Clostridium tetani]|uniref:Sigma factor G inhibitor Gin n=1 Tax=Clostridium tetani TaxID=1513 RepID=A0A4V1LEP7_CLOTA|nr:sigma factor G inhibitor Gin [Clostridium tetani]RXI48705.1 sigma factor G inhibitor Gin [Clostridium tetani]RXM72435.1 sigma factor G inhibitor Gin [Clostridium tetani]BDR63112.1 hypothetical protein K134307016_00460 [Clostridium tetani]BDR65818.1 hypothetical protein K144312032_00460 [Clostridium tetani]BDR71338.1 hypothetical protein K144316041_00460 [Clostridium tetani]